VKIRKIIAIERENSHFRRPRAPTNIGVTLISSQTRVCTLHFRRWWYGSVFIQVLAMGSERHAHNVTVNYCPSGSSGSSKIIDFGTNQKRVYIFLLVVNSTWTLSCTVSEIRRLKCWKSTVLPTPLLFRPKFVSIPMEYPWCWCAQRRKVRLIIRGIIFEDFQRVSYHDPPTLQTDNLPWQYRY